MSGTNQNTKYSKSSADRCSSAKMTYLTRYNTDNKRYHYVSSPHTVITCNLVVTISYYTGCMAT